MALRDTIGDIIDTIISAYQKHRVAFEFAISVDEKGNQTYVIDADGGKSGRFTSASDCLAFIQAIDGNTTAHDILVIQRRLDSAKTKRDAQEAKIAAYQQEIIDKGGTPK